MLQFFTKLWENAILVREDGSGRKRRDSGSPGTEAAGLLHRLGRLLHCCLLRRLVRVPLAPTVQGEPAAWRLCDELLLRPPDLGRALAVPKHCGLLAALAALAE